MSSIEITILSGVSAGDVFRFQLLDSGNSFTIGRSPDCELVLQQAEVSRRHAKIERQENGYFLVDLGSSHGTQHMGFPLSPGDDGKRPLSSGDEFKISDILFRVSIPEERVPKKPVKEKPSEPEHGVKKSSKKKLIQLLVGVAGLLVVLVLLLPAQKSGELPQQKSQEVIFLPNLSVAGYYPGSSALKKDEKDSTHLDLAQFDLPSSDMVVDYEVYAEAPIEVRMDDARVETIPVTGDSWQFRSMLVRDIASGKARRLVFDNTDYPRKPNVKSGPLKKWGVRNVRATPILPQGGVSTGFQSYMKSCLGLAEASDKTADGLFLFVRGLQAAALQLMHEQRIDVFDYSLSLAVGQDEPFPDLVTIQQRLQELIIQSQGATGPEANREILKLLSKSISQYDSEIWRRVNSRLSKARSAVKIQNSIEAHDQLLSAMNMFPADSDLRWSLANRMYLDSKVVPKNVREHPEKFRPRDH